MRQADGKVIDLERINVASISERIEEVLEHYDYAIVSKTRAVTENVVGVAKEYPPSQLRRMLLIRYGVTRIQKVSAGFKVLGK